jgi:NAD(P)H-dependent FMN reductase
MVRLLAMCGSLRARPADRALLDAVRTIAAASGAVVDDFGSLRSIPPFDADLMGGPGPEVYAGSLAGTKKHAPDRSVGSGELHRKVVGVASAGTSGGPHARQVRAQTLAWQGAFVVASLGIEAPRTKSDELGAFTDPATRASIAP